MVPTRKCSSIEMEYKKVSQPKPRTQDLKPYV